MTEWYKQYDCHEHPDGWELKTLANWKKGTIVEVAMNGKVMEGVATGHNSVIVQEPPQKGTGLSMSANFPKA